MKKTTLVRLISILFASTLVACVDEIEFSCTQQALKFTVCDSTGNCWEEVEEGECTPANTPPPEDEGAGEGAHY